MKTLIKYLAYVLIISSFFRIIPIITGIVYHESIISFIITFLISILLGLGLLWYSKTIKDKETGLSLTKGLMLVALSFIILPLIGAVSFLPSFDYNLIDATFESISGFTTTGFTLYSSLDNLPKSLLMWRAETQWMGGIGIIMVFLFIFSKLTAHTYTIITGAESSAKSSLALYQAQGFPEKLEPGLKKTTANILIIYGGYTILGIILLLFTGMSIFNAVGMTFTSLSTGGFTLNDNFYSNDFQLIVLGILMIIGSISFIAHNKLLQKKFKEFLFSFEKNIFLFILLTAIILVVIVYRDIRVVLFELISAFTTTGYSITNISLLPHIFIFLIMIGMIIGGSIASTAGGMKVFRIFYLIKSIPWMLKKLSSPPKAVIPLKIKNKIIEEENLLIVQIFVFCYILILVLGTIIFMLFGNNFLDSSFQIASGLGTVGLQTMELAGINWVCKFVLMIAMLLGRLELFPLLILIRSIFKKSF